MEQREGQVRLLETFFLRLSHELSLLTSDDNYSPDYWQEVLAFLSDE